MSEKSAEKFIIRILNKGFQRAAESFSKLIGKDVQISSSPALLVTPVSEHAFVSEENGELIVLTTQLMGDIMGKSYLILSEDESKEIFKTVGLQLSDQLKEGFLLEIDNIISATVIAELSNELDLEVYGDVPRIFHINARELQDFMKNSMTSDEAASIIFSNTNFHFESGDHIHPQFIWRLSSKIFEIIPEGKLKST